MSKSDFIAVLFVIFVVSSGSLVHSDRPISESNDRLYRRHRYDQAYRSGGPSNLDLRHDRLTSYSVDGTAERHLSPLEVRVNRNRHSDRRDRVPKFYTRSHSPTGIGSDKNNGNAHEFSSNVSGTGNGSRRYSSWKRNERSRTAGKPKGFNRRILEEERNFRDTSLIESHPKLNEFDNSRGTNGNSAESPMGLTKLDEMLQRLENNNELLLQQLRRERDNIAVSRAGHHHAHGRHASHRHSQRRPSQLQDDLYNHAMSPVSQRDDQQTAYDLPPSENLSTDSGNGNRVSPAEHYLYGLKTHHGGQLEDSWTRSERVANVGHGNMRLDDLAPRLDLEDASNNGIASKDEETIVEDVDYQDEEAMIKSRKASPRIHQQTLVDPDSNSLRLASENVRYVMANARCSAPVRRCIDLSLNQTTGGKTFWPRCAIVNRCGEESGCCYSPGHVCSVKESHSIDLYFFFMTSGSESKTGVDRLQFDNHTECECKPRAEPLMHTTVRPPLSIHHNSVTRPTTPGPRRVFDDRHTPDDRRVVPDDRHLLLDSRRVTDDRHTPDDRRVVPDDRHLLLDSRRVTDDRREFVGVNERNGQRSSEDWRTADDHHSAVEEDLHSSSNHQADVVLENNVENSVSDMMSVTHANNDHLETAGVTISYSSAEASPKQDNSFEKSLNTLEEDLSKIEVMQYAAALRQRPPPPPPPPGNAFKKEQIHAPVLKRLDHRLSDTALLAADLLKSSPDRGRSERAPSLVAKECKCPDVYVPSATPSAPGHCECVCDSERGICRRLMKGKRFFKAKDEKCIMSGECGLPTCQFGDFIIEYKRCPRKREMKKLRNKGSDS